MSRTSRNTRLGATAIGAVIVLAAVSGGLVACQGNPSGSTEATATPTTSLTPSSSPTTASPEDEAVDKAEYALKDYYRVTGTALQNPGAFRLDDFKKVAIGSALLDAQNFYNLYVAEGTHDIGSVSVEVVDVHKVDLTNRPKADPPVVPEVQFMACLDSSDVNTVDKDGKSLVAADQQDRSLVRVGVANYEYPSGPWLVAYTEFQEGETC